jgi:hypothetical protein
MGVGAGGGDSTAGGDTWFNAANAAACTDSALCVKGKGGGGATGSVVGAGGASASGVGTTKFSGGDGGDYPGQGGGGGGGAAGLNGAGAKGGTGPGPKGGGGGGGANGGSVGSNSSDDNGAAGGAGASGGGTGGTGGTAAATGGTGSAGGTGTNFDATHGSGAGGGGGGGATGGPGNTTGGGGTGGLYGGGGGGTGSDFVGGATVGTAGSGAAGVIVITYTPKQICFTGNVQFTTLVVSGNLTKSVTNFLIDHPLDPHNKLLSYSAVESNDVKNIYDGVADLDDNGEATVQLPDYFEALNKDFRYQYFAMHEPMPNLYVTEVHDNRFMLKGGIPHGQVSWQITGKRNDAYVRTHTIYGEVDKGPGQPVNKGEYIFPDYEKYATSTKSVQ